MPMSERYRRMAEFEKRFTSDPNSYIVKFYEGMASYHAKLETG